MISLEDYLRRLKDDLEHMNAVASAWSDKSRAARDDLYLVRERQLEMLRAQRERAAARLLEAEAAGETAVDEAVAAAHQAWLDLREAYRAARPYFEHGRRAVDA
jgi:hypothetical protein